MVKVLKNSMGAMQQLTYYQQGKYLSISNCRNTTGRRLRNPQQH